MKCPIHKCFPSLVLTLHAVKCAVALPFPVCLCTCKRGILSEDIHRFWSQHDKDINNTTLRYPAYIRLGSFTRNLYEIQYFSKHCLKYGHTFKAIVIKHLKKCTDTKTDTLDQTNC